MSLERFYILECLQSNTVDRLASHEHDRQISDNNLAFLEIALRMLLSLDLYTLKLRALELPQSAYGGLDTKLQILFKLLDAAVNLPPIEQIEGDYLNIKALLKHLKNDGLEPAAKFDLVDGPNQTLFIISGLQVKEALDAASDCYEFLVPLCSKPHASAWSTPVTRSIASTSREHERKVIEALFGQFSQCESAHEILLSLSDLQPTINLLLSCCSSPNQWQETQCFREYVTIQSEQRQSFPADQPSSCGRFKLKMIEKLCMELDPRKTNSIFQILAKHQHFYKISYLNLPKSSLIEDSVRSLDRLLENGAFVYTTLENFRQSDLFSRKQKNAFALKLARCLMGFLDSDSAFPTWDTRKVFLVTQPDKETPELYVGFTTGNANSLDDFTVRPCHPVMLAFAKLLLEIEEGSKITFKQGSSNLDQWLELSTRANSAKKTGSGLYAEAVSDCLSLLPPEDPKTALRKIVHQIVNRLETALNSLTAGGKRRRSRSPERVTTNIVAQPDNYPTFKKQKFALNKPENSTCKLQDQPMALRPNRPSNPGRVTVFRAREVTLEAGRSIAKVIDEIISINTGDLCRSTFKVKHITHSATSSRRGAALFAFHGLVPERFETIIPSDKSTLFKIDENECSMEVDTKFIGATQLYKPPSEDGIIAEYDT